MPRERSGSFFKREKKLENGKTVVTWWARLTYVDHVTGKRRDRQRRAENRAHAKELVQKLIAEYDATGGRSLEHGRKTFAELAEHYEATYLKPAVYVEGRKVAGVRSLTPAKAAVSALKAYFGVRPLRGITYGDILEYRAARLRTPTRGDLARHERELQEDPQVKVRVTRTIAAVNRELEKLRHMLNIAQREGWILRNPMQGGDPLVSKADEKKRERIITRDEEAKLLEACEGRRAHLRPIIVCALDTGMRRGEIITLRWRDVDFDNRVITIQAFNTKTMRERQVSMTTRLALELERLYEVSPKRPDILVFGVVNNVKRSFTTVRRAAGLDDLRFHDLRHTAATRLVGAHIPLSEVGRVLGHTQANTTYRYVNANIETARRAAAALDAYHSGNETEEPNAETVN
ncbi:MAG TPA: site-specific integrase [Pyrinomonadaceae bacterium]